MPRKTLLEPIDPLTAAGARRHLGALLLPFVFLGPFAASRASGGLAQAAPWFARALILRWAACLDATVTNASVLVDAGFIHAPVLVCFLHGERPLPGLTARAALATMGLSLMSGGNGPVTTGDLLALASAVASAMWTILLCRHLRAGGATALAATVQLVARGVLAPPTGLWLASPSGAAIWAAAPDLFLFAGISSHTQPVG